MKKNQMKRIVSLLLALVLTLSAIPFFATEADAATSGARDSSTYCYVKINNSLITKKGTQYATVKLNTYDGTGWYNTKAYVRVTLRDGRTDAHICTWVARGGDTLKLGDDHSSYKIFVSAYEEPVSGGIISRTIKGGNNFSNLGNSVKWSVQNPKNCSIS